MKPLKVLIVDDNEDYAEGMADILETKGYLSVIANSGIEALEKFRAGEIDLTFMDVKMPGMDGVETFKAILEIQPKAKVVMMTAYSVESLLEEALHSGAKGVLHKPINIEEIFSIIENIENNIVLLVDDEPDFTSGISDILKKQGYKVEAANSGNAAIDRILKNNIKVLLIDLRMPEIDGMEVLRRLDQLGHHIPTVILSGYLEEESERLRSLTTSLVSGVLKKPVKPKELINLLDKIENKSR